MNSTAAPTFSDDGVVFEFIQLQATMPKTTMARHCQLTLSAYMTHPMKPQVLDLSWIGNGMKSQFANVSYLCLVYQSAVCRATVKYVA